MRLRQTVHHLARTSAWVGSALAVVVGRATTASLAAEGESPAPYEIVAVTAVNILPAPLRDDFQSHMEAIKRGALSPRDGSTSSSSAPRLDRAECHYVHLDIAAVDQADPKSRRAAARMFPRDRHAAEVCATQLGKPDVGTLPWVIEDTYKSLGKDFSERHWNHVHQRAGVLLHFVTDAALPFNARTPDEAGPAGDSNDRRGRALESAVYSFIARHRARLDYEVRVLPDRFVPLREPMDAVFGLLLDSHEKADALLAMDAEAWQSAGLPGNDENSDHAAWAACDAGLGEPGMAMLEAQLEAAALLSANLIGTAWIEAGKPQPPVSPRPEIHAEKATVPALAPQAIADKTTGGFMGSMSSQIFHRASCQHVRRIKPDNAIHYATAAEALAAGRTACKTCRPDAP